MLDQLPADAHREALWRILGACLDWTHIYHILTVEFSHQRLSPQSLLFPHSQLTQQLPVQHGETLCSLV